MCESFFPTAVLDEDRESRVERSNNGKTSPNEPGLTWQVTKRSKPFPNQVSFGRGVSYPMRASHTHLLKLKSK